MNKSNKPFTFRNPDAKVTTKQAYLLARFFGPTSPKETNSAMTVAALEKSGMTVSIASGLIDKAKTKGLKLNFYWDGWTDKPNPKLVKKAAPKTKAATKADKQAQDLVAKLWG